MTLSRPAIFAVLALSLAAPSLVRAAEPSSETAIVKASQAHVGSAQAAAEFQKSQSQLAAESLIQTIQAGAAASASVEPAAGVSLFEKVPKVRQTAFTVQNEIIQPSAKPAAAISRARPTYNQ